MTRLRGLIWLLSGIALASDAALAEYIVPPAAVRLAHADTVVVGVLEGLVLESRDGVDYETGSIAVTKVFAGHVAPGDQLRIRWENSAKIACPRTGHPQAENKVALWLLDAPKGDLFRGSFPEYTILLGPSEAGLASFERELSESVQSQEVAPIVTEVLQFLKIARVDK